QSTVAQCKGQAIFPPRLKAVAAIRGSRAVRVASMRILALETTGQSGSIALLQDETIVREATLPQTERSAKSLAPAIQRILSESRWKAREIELITVATGPGSFTGLRIGVTTAKTLAYAIGAQVIGVNTLQAIAAQAPSETYRLWAIVDAQRQQVFAGE